MSIFGSVILFASAIGGAAQSSDLPDDPHRPHLLGNPGAVFTNDDYPPELSRAGIAGSVKMAFAVDVSGHPTDCQIVESSGSTKLDKATCATAMRRLHFRPATNDAGESIASVYILPTVNWHVDPINTGRELELSNDAPTVKSLSKIDIDIGSDGRVTGCRIPWDSKEPKSACDGIKKGTQITGPLTVGGHPAKATATLQRTLSIKATSLAE